MVSALTEAQEMGGHSNCDRPSSPADALREYLAELAEISRSTDAGAVPVDQAAALAEAQRVAAWALRAAVELARAGGTSWRDLATLLDMPAATLHRQYYAGQGLVMSCRDGSRPRTAGGPADHVAGVPGRGEGGSRQPATGGRPHRPCNLFVGREVELADLAVMLQRRRVVTLTGPPGAGKTRLALEVLPAVSGYFRSTWWVDLAHVAEDGIATAILSVAGASSSSSQLGEVIGEAAVGGPMLLVLDNCEHVVSACAELVGSETFQHPRLTILATSREPLEITAERQMRVGLLPPVASEADLQSSAAARLFVDRVRSLAPGFDPAENAELIARICDHLEGLPLAIELAAYQIRALTPGSLSTLCAAPLDMLAGGHRDGIQRHSSLRSAIGWSYDLLDSAEKAVFRRLSILPGGFDLSSATALTADMAFGRTSLWAILAQLVAKSLILPDVASPTRFRLLEPIRAFGGEQLDARQERGQAHSLLLDWLSSQALRISHDRLRTSDPELQSWSRAEVANIALGIEIARVAGDPRYPDLGLLMGWIWNIFPNSESAREKAAHMADHLLHWPGATTAQRVEALILRSVVSVLNGEHAAGRATASQAVATARTTADQNLLVRSLHALSAATTDPQCALALDAEQVDLLRSAADTDRLSLLLGGMAWRLLVLGRPAEAMRAVDEALALRIEHREPAALHTAGAIALAVKDADLAGKYFAEALLTSKDMPTYLPYDLEGLGLAALADEKPDRALRLISASGAMRSALGMGTDPWWLEQVQKGSAAARRRLDGAAAEAAESGAALGHDELIRYALEDQLPPPRPESGSIPPLTTRETEIAHLVSSGFTSKQIAARLAVGIRTVDNHLANIRTKLNLENRAQITHWVSSRDQGS
jgi:predicted ATPase/DNA-binding CsgD family transcriptional regulator